MTSKPIPRCGEKWFVGSYKRVLGFLLGSGYYRFIWSCFGQILQADTDPNGRFIMPQARYGHAVSLYCSFFPPISRRLLGVVDGTGLGMRRKTPLSYLAARGAGSDECNAAVAAAVCARAIFGHQQVMPLTLGCRGWQSIPLDEPTALSFFSFQSGPRVVVPCCS